MKSTLGAVVLIILLSGALVAQELNTILMESTFKILGRSRVDTLLSVGTVFFIIRPYTDTAKQGRIFLVTAAHVLDSIVADSALVVFRKKVDSHTYLRLPSPIRIRDKGKPLWTRHPDPSIDIAAMKAYIPSGLNLGGFLGTKELASDSILNTYEIHPGDDALTLGYPYGIEANPSGFPILRSGKIASYPLTPSRVTKAFLLDMNIYEGNSGGPVYISYTGRVYNNIYNMVSINYVVGVVSQQGFSSPTHETALQLGVVVPAQFILETLELIK